MKAVIPVAGVGTRLRPHTHTIPKALIHVAGKPIIGYILDELVRLGVEDVILVIGYLGDQILQYVTQEYTFRRLDHVEQKDRRGLGHAISLTEPLVEEEPVLMVYGDTIFEGDLRNGIDDRVDGKIGVKAVEDPRRFGVVQVEGNRIIRLVEKPPQFVSNLAIAGVNYIRNSALLFRCLRELLEKKITTRGEYQVTDAFERMVESGAYLEVFSVENWFDCGNLQTLLTTNRHLLSKRKGDADRPGSIIRPPVYIAPSAIIVNSVIGPYTSIAEGAHVEESIVKDCIVGEQAVVRSCLLSGSLIGDHAQVYGYAQRLNVGDSSEVHLGGGTPGE